MTRQRSTSAHSPGTKAMEIQFIFDPKHKETLSGRVRTACLTCRRRKTKCDGMADGDVSCQICREKGIECEGFSKRKRPQRAGAAAGDQSKSAKSRGGANDRRLGKTADLRSTRKKETLLTQNRSSTAKPLAASRHSKKGKAAHIARPKHDPVVTDEIQVVDSFHDAARCILPAMSIDMISQSGTQDQPEIFDLCMYDSEHTDFDQAIPGSQSSDWEIDCVPISEQDRRGSSSTMASEVSSQLVQLEQAVGHRAALAGQIQDNSFFVDPSLSMLDSDEWANLPVELATQEYLGNIPFAWDDAGKMETSIELPCQLQAANSFPPVLSRAQHPSLSDYDGALFVWPEK